MPFRCLATALQLGLFEDVYRVVYVYAVVTWRFGLDGSPRESTAVLVVGHVQNEAIAYGVQLLLWAQCASLPHLL